jgi:hypothetical protein
MKPTEVEKILNRLMNLPPEAQKEVADFISILYECYRSSFLQQLQEKFAHEDFIGLWKDRLDTQYSTS